MKTTHYSTNAQIHSGGFSTFHVIADGIEGEIKSQHSGLEVIYGSQFKMKLRNHTWEGPAVRLSNAMMVYNGLEEHTELYDPDDSLRMSAVVIHADLINQLGKEVGFNAENLEVHRVFWERPDAELINIFTIMMQLRDLPGLSTYYHDCLATDLAVRILTHIDHNFTSQIQKQSEKKSFPQHFAKAKQIMREELTNPDFSLDDLSGACGLSKFHFVRMFKQNVGIAPHQYLCHLKVDRAKQLLIHTDLCINGVAELLGFTDQSTFTKLFKRLTGLSASGYRASGLSEPQYFG